MNDRPSDPVLHAALTRKPSSGEHPAVRTYHAHLEAIEKGQMPSVRAVTERMRESLEKARTDPRRDPDSRRPAGSADDLPPVDVVMLQPPRPSVPRPSPRARVRAPSRPDGDR